MNILSLFSFGSRDQIFNLQISINGLVLWFQGFHSIHHLPLQAENSPDNYSWLHRRFIGEHWKPTIGGCGWRQGSLTLSFMIGHMTMIVMFLLVMWAQVIIHYSFIKMYYPKHVKDILDSPSLSMSRFFMGNLRFQMVSHRKISQPGWLISQNCFSQQMDSRHKNWLCQF
jgi:hypothetical protein